MSVNCSRSSIECIHSSFFDDSRLKSVFLHGVVRALCQQQLTQINKSDKSPSQSNFCTVLTIKSLQLLLIRCRSLSIAVLFGLLLLRQGIESNPGPFPDPNAATFKSSTYDGNRNGSSIITQNCRGLTEPAKLTALLKKSFGNPNHAKVLCLQETHQINRFALDNHHRGESVVDNGERGQRGTAILVSEHFKIHLSRTSGNGRWAIAAISDKSSGAGVDLRPIVVATIYAPNCHREAVSYFERFFGALDEFVDEVSEQLEWPHLVITGDFNFVFNPDQDSLNRQFSQNESILAAMVESYLDERECIDCICFNSSDKDRFTWRRANCCSRLDYIFVSAGLSSRIRQFRTDWFVFGSKYDHAAVSIKVARGIKHSVYTFHKK